MRRLIDESFEVSAPIERAWDHLARVERWPTWAKHIKSVIVTPKGPLSSDTQARVRLKNGLTSTFKMIELQPLSHWKWRGTLLGAQIDYDHVFSQAGPIRTTVRFTIDAAGWQAAIVGGLFAAVYRRNLRAAIPSLIAEIEASPESTADGPAEVD